MITGPSGYYVWPTNKVFLGSEPHQHSTNGVNAPMVCYTTAKSIIPEGVGAVYTNTNKLKADTYYNKMPTVATVFDINSNRLPVNNNRNGYLFSDSSSWGDGKVFYSYGLSPGTSGGAYTAGYADLGLTRVFGGTKAYPQDKISIARRSLESHGIGCGLFFGDTNVASVDVIVWLCPCLYRSGIYSGIDWNWPPLVYLGMQARYNDMGVPKLTYGNVGMVCIGKNTGNFFVYHAQIKPSSSLVNHVIFHVSYPIITELNGVALYYPDTAFGTGTACGLEVAVSMAYMVTSK